MSAKLLLDNAASNSQAKQSSHLLSRQPSAQGSQMMTQQYADQAAQAIQLQDAAGMVIKCCINNHSTP